MSSDAQFGFINYSWERGTDGKWSHKQGSRFVREYAGTNPAEDFAEACMNYILHPAHLKDTDPGKYDFMKEKVFKNQEWIDHPPFQNTWPELESFLQNPLSCALAFQPCMKNMVYNPQAQLSYCEELHQGNTVNTTCSTSSGRIFGQSNCVAEIAPKAAVRILNALRPDEETFCGKGGLTAIEQALKDRCAGQGNVLWKNYGKAYWRLHPAYDDRKSE